MSRSQNPPYQGALLGMNYHRTPRRLKVTFSLVEVSSCSSSLAADVYVEALSESITCGKDL